MGRRKLRERSLAGMVMMVSYPIGRWAKVGVVKAPMVRQLDPDHDPRQGPLVGSPATSVGNVLVQRGYGAFYGCLIAGSPCTPLS